MCSQDQTRTMAKMEQALNMDRIRDDGATLQVEERTVLIFISILDNNFQMAIKR